jgi:ATP-dependent exoDNAse (exonuclease V) alpha subunit
MPVRITSNQCVRKGVVNGACGEVQHIDWSRDTTFVHQHNGAWLASKEPTNIYVNLHNSPTPTPFPLIPARWPSSVMPVLQITSAVTMKGPALSIKGFPLVPAFATTVHGVQGETKDSVAITNLRPPNVRNADQHALYVALSRLKTRQGLYWIGKRPTEDDNDYFHPMLTSYSKTKDSSTCLPPRSQSLTYSQTYMCKPVLSTCFTVLVLTLPYPYIPTKP